MSVVSLISLPATYAPNPNFVPPTSKMGWSNFQPISSQPDTAVQLQNPHLTLTNEVAKQRLTHPKSGCVND